MDPTIQPEEPQVPSRFSELRPQDIYRVLCKLPKDVRSLLMEQKIYLAGGFIRAVIAGEELSDIDLFGEGRDFLEAKATSLALSRKGRVYETKNAFTVLAAGRTPVQFIHRWQFRNWADLLNSFDFTIAKAVIWYQPEQASILPSDSNSPPIWKSATAPTFYPDLAAHRLTYTFPVREEAPGGSFMRARKFIKKGYYADPVCLAGVIARMVGKLAFQDSSDYENEKRVTKIIAGMLEEVDPNTVIDGIEMSENSTDLENKENGLNFQIAREIDFKESEPVNPS